MANKQARFSIYQELDFNRVVVTLLDLLREQRIINEQVEASLKLEMCERLEIECMEVNSYEKKE